MKIKVTDPILDYENKPIKGVNDEITLWRTIFFVALNNFAKDETPTSEMKEKSYKLTKSIFDKEEVDLSVAERAYLLERIEKMYPQPLICGKAKELFEEITTSS